MIQIKLKNSSASHADGMRLWAGYVADTVSKKIKGMTLVEDVGATKTYRMGDTTAQFTMSADVQTFEFTLALRALDKDGSETNNIPVGPLVILMVFLHYTAGRKQAGAMVRLSAIIGAKTYSDTDKEDIKAVYRALKQLVPPQWYLPYAEGVYDASEMITARQEKQKKAKSA